MAQQRQRHGGHVPRAGIMPLGVEAAGVYKTGMRHAQLRRAGVHHFSEHRLGAAHKFRHGDRRVVGAAHADGLDKLIQSELLARLQPDLAAAHIKSMLTDGHDIRHGNLPRLHRLQCEQQRHDLGDRRHGHLGVRLFFIQDVAGVDGNEDRVAARDIQLRFCEARVFLHRRGNCLVRVGRARPRGAVLLCGVCAGQRCFLLCAVLRGYCCGQILGRLLRCGQRRRGKARKGKRGQQNDCRQPHPIFPFHHNHPPQFRGLSIIYMKHARPACVDVRTALVISARFLYNSFMTAAPKRREIALRFGRGLI